MPLSQEWAGLDCSTTGWRKRQRMLKQQKQGTDSNGREHAIARWNLIIVGVTVGAMYLALAFGLDEEMVVGFGLTVIILYNGMMLLSGGRGLKTSFDRNRKEQRAAVSKSDNSRR